MRTQFPIMVALAGLAATSPNRMAGQDIAGTWDVTWAQAVRVNRDESVKIQKWGTGLLVLRQDGDRLEGEMTILFRGTQRARAWRPWRAVRHGPG